MSHSLFRSLVSNWIGLGLSILIGFLISPLVVQSLGQELYGYWALIISITSQAIVFDFGARNAIVTYVARFRKSKDIKSFSEFMSTGLFYFGLCGALALLILVCFLPLFGSVFEVKPSYIFLIQVVFVIAAIDAAAEVACGFYDGVLAGSERYDLMNFFNVIRLVLNLIGVYLVLIMSWGLIGIAFSTLLSRMLQRWLQAIFAIKQNPGINISYSLIRQPVLRQIGAYGLKASLAQAAYRLIYRADTIIAGVFVGASGAAIYSIPVILIDQFRMFAESGNYILTPRYSALSAANDRSTIHLLMLKWSKLSFLLAIAIGCPLYFTGGDFINLWIGKSFSASTPIIQLLCLPFLFTLPSMSCLYFLYASNQHKYCAYLLGLEALASIALATILVQSFGLSGIAFAALLPAIILRGLVLPYLVCKINNLRLASFYRVSIINSLPLLACQIAAFYVLKLYLPDNSWLNFLLINLVALASMCVLSYAYYLDQEDKAYILRRLKRST